MTRKEDSNRYKANGDGYNGPGHDIVDGIDSLEFGHKESNRKSEEPIDEARQHDCEERRVSLGHYPPRNLRLF